MTQASSLIDQPAVSALAYPSTQLFINGQWQDATDGKTLAVFNPATGKEIGRVAHASKADLDKALEAAAMPSAEMPFGGVKDSGYGSEGGPEAMEAYLNVRAVAIMNV